MIDGVLQTGPLEWEVPIGYVPNMRVPGRFFLSPSLASSLETGAVKQLAEVATLPGIITNSLAMPDIHWGYGFPIGGVAAFGMDDGVISPGGVGFDINCGVRLMTTPLSLADLKNKKEVIEALYTVVPVGVGARSKRRLSQAELSLMMEEGAGWAVREGYGTQTDIDHCEEQGCMKEADISFISDKARLRGLPQSGTLGAGNHFLELQIVQEIYDTSAATAFGLVPGSICVMIHCGSRGLGHQVCTDHIKELEHATQKYNIHLPDRQLACAPLTSPEGEAYFGAMAASANYAWANRQMIMHETRKIIEKMCGVPYDEMQLVYDVAHNVAKKEEHNVQKSKKMVCVHRKGATRAFGPGSHDLPFDYASIGQPVIIPGSMGTSSYVLKGTEFAMEKTFGSTCHGAGRIMSRSQAKKNISGKGIRDSLLQRGILVKAPHDASIAEEAPDVYKSSSEVVSVVDTLGISKRVARLEPLAVIKG